MVYRVEDPSGAPKIEYLIEDIFSLNPALNWSILGRAVTKKTTGGPFKGEELKDLVDGKRYYEARYDELKADLAMQLAIIRDQLRRDPLSLHDRFPISPELVEGLRLLRDQYGVTQREMIEGTGIPESRMSNLLDGQLVDEGMTIQGALFRRITEIYGRLLEAAKVEKAQAKSPENMRQSVEAVQNEIIKQMYSSNGIGLLILDCTELLDRTDDLMDALKVDGVEQGDIAFYPFLIELDGFIGHEHGSALEALNYEEGTLWEPEQVERFREFVIPKLQAKVESLRMRALFDEICDLNQSITPHALAQAIRDRTTISKGEALVGTINGEINWEVHRRFARLQMIEALEDVLQQVWIDRFCINGSIAVANSDLKDFVDRLGTEGAMSHTAIAQEMGIHFSFLSDLLLGNSHSLKREPYERLQALYHRTFEELVLGGETVEAVRHAIVERLRANLLGNVIFFGGDTGKCARVQMEPCHPPQAPVQMAIPSSKIPWVVANQANVFLLGVGDASVDPASHLVKTDNGVISRFTEMIFPRGKGGIMCRITIEPNDSRQLLQS